MKCLICKRHNCTDTKCNYIYKFKCMCGCNRYYNMNELNSIGVKPSDKIKCKISQLTCKKCRQNVGILYISTTQSHWGDSIVRKTYCWSCTMIEIKKDIRYPDTIINESNNISGDWDFIKREIDRHFTEQNYINKGLKTLDAIQKLHRELKIQYTESLLFGNMKECEELSRENDELMTIQETIKRNIENIRLKFNELNKFYESNDYIMRFNKTVLTIVSSLLNYNINFGDDHSKNHLPKHIIYKILLFWYDSDKIVIKKSLKSY